MYHWNGNKIRRLTLIGRVWLDGETEAFSKEKRTFLTELQAFAFPPIFIDRDYLVLRSPANSHFVNLSGGNHHNQMKNYQFGNHDNNREIMLKLGSLLKKVTVAFYFHWDKNKTPTFQGLQKWSLQAQRKNNSAQRNLTLQSPMLEAALYELDQIHKEPRTS